MITIYHNPRCRKSREGLAIVEEHAQDFGIVEYIKNPLSISDLREIIDKLGIEPIDLVRKNESIWKEKYKGKDLSDDDIIKALSNNPKLIERPIVVKNNKAVIGRPPTNIESLLAK